MGTRSFIITGLLGIALATGGAVMVHATSSGYLAKVGPTPLRFKPPPVRKRLEAKPLSANPHPESSVPTAPESNADSLINWPWLSPESSQPQDSLFGSTSPASKLPQPAGQPAEASSHRPSANELLVITPQMLIDYFKPMAGATNGAGVSVLLPVNFTPPTPSAAPSSQAIYKTQ
ncbi:MAG TPA: hypothetical protein VK327_06810 [Candidatus Paceibacterota bacterium]|nr:hypothetical protein [Candidatus Paceibacterota bacterium]